MPPPSASVRSPVVLRPSATALHVHGEDDHPEALGRDIPRATSPSIEARRASWNRLWEVLLREPANDDVEQQGSESSSEATETNAAAARAALSKEVVMVE